MCRAKIGLRRAVLIGRSGLFILDVPSGTGKTFLINMLLAYIRSQGEIALTLASSGITATLLDGGKTTHSALNYHYICILSKLRHIKFLKVQEWRKFYKLANLLSGMNAIWHIINHLKRSIEFFNIYK